MSHGDAVTEIPADFIRTGTSADCPFASIENPDKKNLRNPIPTLRFVTLFTVMISCVTLP